MKKALIILAFSFSLLLVANGQIGDFQLDNKGNRQYIKIVADPKLKGNAIKRMLVGKNYRSEWTDTINIPVLNLSTDFGGLKPVDQGGGKQTRSLDLVDASGNKWALRSVKKFTDQGLEDIMKGTFAGSLMADGISASFPFSVLSVGTMAKAAGVPYFPNTLVFIPDDPLLGEYRSDFKNLLAFLELRTLDNDTTLKLKNTEDLVPDLFKSSSKKVNEIAVLRARLLDNFIMDFDRHDGQWEWIKKDSAGFDYYSPVPKDRDQAFFDANGVLPYFLSKKAQLGPIQGFKAEAEDIKTFNYSQRDFDRFFLTELERSDWEIEIDRFISAMTDQVIDEAIAKQPKDLSKEHTGDISNILKTKRYSFRKSMLEYYNFLSEVVSVHATNDDEVITIKGEDDNSVQVSIETINDKNQTMTLYSRLFDPSETKEIRIYGLEGDDTFHVVGDINRIDVRLIGGPGEDQFNSSSAKRIKVYDVSFEPNTVTGKGIKDKISKDPMTNEFRRLGNTYNTSYIGLYPEYSSDGGLFIGPSLKTIRTGFRKEPYSSKQLFFVTRAINTPSYHINYTGEFISIGKNLDLFLNSEFQLPTVRTKFFGFGNNTTIDENRPDEYYSINYTLIDARALLQHRINSALKFSYGPVFQHLRLPEEKNKGSYISQFENGISKDELYESHSFIGGEVNIGVDTRNDLLIPTRGIQFNVYTRPLLPIKSDTKTLLQSGGKLSLFTDFISKNRIILATSFGADHNSGSYYIPQAQYLGFKQNLRGYEYQRFAGDRRAYNNSEARINFGNVNLYLAKGPFGILGFHDIARVWTEDEESDDWHTGYGGGIWMAPYNKIVVTALVTSSKEERLLPLVRIGFQF